MNPHGKQLQLILKSDKFMSEWMKEHIKTPPPVNVTEEQRKQAREKLEQMKQLKTSKINLS